MRKTAVRTSFLFSKKRLTRTAALCLTAAVLAACVSKPPYEEYSLAQTALRAAEEADSSKYSPSHWLNAESSYREGEQAYKLNEFDKARTLFIRARLSAEKAENQTRLKKFKSGDVFQ
jgi:hypothetical protein